MGLIKVNDLKIGMKIGKNVYNKDGVLLLEKNVKITSEKQIEILKTAGIKYVNTINESINSKKEETTIKEISATEIALNEINSKLNQAMEQIDKVINLTGEVFDQIIDEDNITEETAKKTKEIVGNLIEDIENNQEIFSSIEELKKKDQNLLHHSVNVTTNIILMGLQLEIPKDKLLQIGTAALLHDIGKLKISNKILTKNTQLTPEEFEEYKKHVEYSLYYISKMGTIENLAINLIKTHHEYLDGTGFPKGIKNIDKISQLLVITNEYNNLISSNNPSIRVNPVNAISKLSEMAEKKFFQEVFISFINTIGVYPVGTLVQLNNGDVGKVIVQNKKDPKHPKVLIKFDKYRKLKTKLIDTSLKTRAGSASKYIHYIQKVIDIK